MFTALSLDPALGRIDYKSLPDQTLMELLVEGMNAESKKALQDENGHYKDISDWGVATRSENDRVSEVLLSGRPFNETQFPFALIPPLVTYFEASDSELSGTLDASVLPADLVDFCISTNKLHGSVECKAFPRKMNRIYIDENNFSGILALCDLPDTLNEFYATANKFSGEISLNDLPAALEELMLDENELSGTVRIDRLPEQLRCFSLGDNKLSGDFALFDFPETLCSINVRNNPWSGTMVLPANCDEVLFWFRGTPNISLVVDEYGNRHPLEEEILSNT